MSEEDIQRIKEAAERLAQARVAFARSFLMNKISADGIPVTDKTAEHRATEATGSEITFLEVDLQLLLIQASLMGRVL